MIYIKRDKRFPAELLPIKFNRVRFLEALGEVIKNLHTKLMACQILYIGSYLEARASFSRDFRASSVLLSSVVEE